MRQQLVFKISSMLSQGIDISFKGLLYKENIKNIYKRNQDLKFARK
jgi:hypothetical protein